MTPLPIAQTEADLAGSVANNNEGGKAKKKRRRNRKKKRNKKSKAAAEGAQEQIDSGIGSKNQNDATDTVQTEELVVNQTIKTATRGKRGAGKKPDKAKHTVEKREPPATAASGTKKEEAAISTRSSDLDIDEFSTVLSFSKFATKPSSSSPATVKVHTAPIPSSAQAQRVINAAISSTLSNGIVTSSSSQQAKKEIISDSLAVDEGRMGLSYSSFKAKITKATNDTTQVAAPSSPAVKERGPIVAELDSPSVETPVSSMEQSTSAVVSLSNKPVAPQVSSSSRSWWGAFPSLSLKLQPQYYSTFISS